MSRRLSKRTDLVPDYYDGDVPDALSDQLLLEIEIRQGQGRAFPLAGEVRDDLNRFFNLQVSDEAWRSINFVTARYILKEQQYRKALSASKVKSACRALIEVIDNLVETFRKLDPDVRKTIEQHGFIDLSIEQLIESGRPQLIKLVNQSSVSSKISAEAPWDEWIRNLARIARTIGIMPSGEGPDRSGKASDFVKLALRIQSELPEDLALHEPDPGSPSTQSTFARAVRRALEKGLGLVRYRAIELKNIASSPCVDSNSKSPNSLESPAILASVSRQVLLAFSDFRRGPKLDGESGRFLKLLVDMANTNGRSMHAQEIDAAHIIWQEKIANSPVVYGVWSDPGSIYGVGTYLIKGRDQVRASTAGGVEIKITAVPCFSYDGGVAANIAHGDGTGNLRQIRSRPSVQSRRPRTSKSSKKHR
jgi:hypothetical protein